jgi:hypothetical protein
MTGNTAAQPMRLQMALHTLACVPSAGALLPAGDNTAGH